MTPAEITATLALDPAERYKYLLAFVATAQEIWIVEDEEQKLLTMGDPDEALHIPVWPAEAYAQEFITEEWADYHPAPIPLEDFLEMLDDLEEDGVAMAVFPTLAGGTVVTSPAELKKDLLEASEKQA